MLNKTTITPIVGLIFAALAFFKVGLPETMTQAGVVAAIMIVAATVTMVLRFADGDEYAAGVKAWWQSKVIWTQVGQALAAVLVLFGITVGITPEAFAQFAMLMASLAAMLFGSGKQKKIAKAGA